MSPNQSKDVCSHKPWIRHPLIPVVFFVMLLAFGFQGSRHLWQPDEGYNAAVTTEMMDSGDLLIQRLDGQIYLGKPPMYIWCTIPGIWIFGRNEFGLRAFCATCYALTAWIVGLIGASMWKRREGILSALVYTTMLLPFGAANIGRPDTPLVFATTATLYCFWRSIMPNATNVAIWKMLLCVAIAWGFEMKATAVLVPVAPMFLYLLLTHQALSYFTTLWSIVGLLLFAGVGLSWFIYTAIVLPGAGAFLWDSLVTGRLVTATYGRNPTFLAGVKMYVPTLLAGTMPWLPVWFPLARKLQAAHSGKQWVVELRANPKVMLLVLWIVLPLAIYFLASSKLILYVLPIFPAFALLTARTLTEFMPGTFGSDYPVRRVWVAVGIWGVMLLGLKLYAAYYPHSKDEGALWQAMRDKVPTNCSRIVVVNEDLDGLHYYSGKDVMRVTTGLPISETDYKPPRVLDEGLSAKAPFVIVFLNYHMRQSNRDRLQDLLRQRNLQSEEFPLPFERTLLVCTEIHNPAG